MPDVFSTILVKYNAFVTYDNEGVFGLFQFAYFKTNICHVNGLNAR